MIRKILIPIRGDGKGENVLAHAAALARRFDAHVDAVHCRPRPEDLLPFGVPVPAFLREQIAGSAKDVADAEEAKLRTEFDQLVTRYGLSLVGAPNGGARTASWREESGKQVDVIKTHGRLADLICVAKPDRDRNLGFNTLKAALFNTGRPVMMCPHQATPPETLGEHLAIAWNGSTEAARAVALTLDLIQKATAVTVLTAGAGEAHGAGAEDLIAYLAVRGVSARLERFDVDGGVGRALLERTTAVGADLLIMGAYGDSHERETLFGGNTQEVVDRATRPVVLVH